MSEDALGSSQTVILPRPVLDIWSLDSRQMQLLVWPVLLGAVAYALVQYVNSFLAQDFFALWSYGRLLRDHPVADIYDPVRLHALQIGLGMNPIWDAPFPYPPIFLFVVWPLGLLPVGVAYWAWMGPALIAFLWAAAGPRPLDALIVASLPAATVCIAAGQSGFLTAALLVGGLRLVTARPWLGGLLLGILTFKPHLGLMVPVALAAAGAWRGMATTAAVAAGLAALTIPAFGAGAWVDWLTTLPGYQDRFDLKLEDLHLRPTVMANLAMAGSPAALAHAAQAVTMAAMAALVWACCRRGLSRTAIAVVIAATVAANPHAFFYDLPMLTAAVLFLGQARVQAGGRLHWAETGLLMLVLCVPVALLWIDQPISMPVLLLFALWAGWQGLQETGGWPARQAAANCNSASRAYSPP